MRLNYTQHNYNMKTRQEILLKAKEYAESIGSKDGTVIYDYAMGYTQCQEDMLKEIQSLIDGYNSDILLLEEEFKDSSSVLIVEKMVTLQDVIHDLYKTLNKQD